MRLATVDDARVGIAKRQANLRLGHVYVISNIGAFGERMVKIGVTRRLDPNDRIRELGDASVPFRFDTQAIIFSEDAVGLERNSTSDSSSSVSTASTPAGSSSTGHRQRSRDALQEMGKAVHAAFQRTDRRTRVARIRGPRARQGRLVTAR